MASFPKYPLSLPNGWYSNPPHPQVHISTSRLTSTLHGTTVWCVPTHQLNTITQYKCGGLWGQCVSSHPNIQIGATKIICTKMFLCLKVNMRAWYATQLLNCWRTIRRIVHSGLLQNWKTTSKYSTQAIIQGNCTWRRIPEMRVKGCLPCLQLVLDDTQIARSLTTT